MTLGTKGGSTPFIDFFELLTLCNRFVERLKGYQPKFRKY